MKKKKKTNTPTTKRKQNRLTAFRLSAALLKKADSVCVELDLARSQLFRRSIVEFIDRQAKAIIIES